MRTIRRFYKEAGCRSVAGGYEVILDGRGIKTPLAAALIIPTRALAEAIAAEWSAQGNEISPAAMPLTQLANTVVDRVLPARESFRAAVAAFVGSDLICHRAETPADLVRRQEELWAPLVDWAAERHGARLAVGLGIMPLAQPPAALAALADAVRVLDDWTLAAVGAVAAASGSLVLALALVEGHVDSAEACRAALLDETWQMERWGEDAEELKRQKGVVADITAAGRFAKLARN